MMKRHILAALFAASLPLIFSAYGAGQTYDIVIHGGRVMDPETGLDAVRDVGISGKQIEAVASNALRGTRIIDARGLIVAPGFIDLHQHGQTPQDYKLKAFDGVTTALEMEIGRRNVAKFLNDRKGHALINYGTTASHPMARAWAFDATEPASAILPTAGPATDNPASPEQILKMEDHLRSELDAGGLGIGMGLQYTPGATRLEVIDMFRVAAERHLPVYTHVRSAGVLEPGSSVESVGEVIAAAAVTGAPLHIVHVNSSCLKSAPNCLAMITGARGQGLDITTEAYPYRAGMTELDSALFNPGWRKKFGIDYKDVALPNSGERLTKQRFDELRASKKPMLALLYLNDEATVDSVIRNPLVMIASDGADGHPRNAGTYCRILARYVRQQQSLTMMDAIRKMSLMPAQVLADSTPEGLKKGRIQKGADADIVAFDPATVSDRATYASPELPSVGMKYVLVGGTPVIEDGRLVPNVFPGRPLIGTSYRSAPSN
jgi:N-acyl-D-aspartate/D-glutamate deacylase